MIWSSGAYGAHFGSFLEPKSAKREPNGTKVVPKTPKMDFESTKMEPNGDHGEAKITQKTCPGRGPRIESQKRGPRAGNNQATGTQMSLFLDSCGSFWGYFFNVFSRSFFD